ncbi:MAG: LamG domain-containing protein, partial [Planctomycetota bacterium]
PAIDVGEWTHVAVVHNGSQWRLYRNGELFATNTTSQGAINTASGLWAIGSPSGLANRFFDGQIDEVRVYSRALSDADIDMLYLDGWATKRLLMIVTDADSPSSEELDRKAEFEGWGYAVYLITSTDSQSEYDDALVGMDVAYVPEDIASGDVASKLREATIGVVSEEPFLDDDLGFSDSDGSSKSGTDLDIVDDTHPITSGFSLGTLTILSTAERLVRIEGTTATGGSVLAEADSSPGLMVVETGAALANSYNGSSVAFGRRVRLPIGGNDFVWAYLNSDGLQLFRNALDWASSGSSTSLVAHWDFDEGTGTTVADESGNGNDASFDAGTPAWTTGVRGYALQFDGSSDVETDANFDPPAVGSVSFWLRAAATPTGNERLFGVANSWEARTDATGAVYFDLHAGAGGIFSTPAGVLSPGRWRHVVAVYDSVDDTYSTYVDGELVGAGSVTLDDQDGSSRLSFGTRNGSTERFNGDMDDVRVYSVELTLAEVQELYGLLAHYTLDETSGTTVADSSGLGNDATHVDGPTVGASAVRSSGATYNGADSNDRTDLPHDLLDEKSAYSLAWWVRSQGAGVQTILSGANSGQSNAALIVFSDDDTL